MGVKIASSEGYAAGVLERLLMAKLREVSDKAALSP